MAARQTNVELLTPTENMMVPSCSHGPALLFEQYDQSSNSFRQFFACSAFRDKKECGFHMWVGDRSDEHSKTSSSFIHKQARLRFRSFKALPKSKRYVCCTCGLLLMPPEIQEHEKQGHPIKGKVTLRDLKKPSFLFTPLDNNKTFAQYLFSPKTVDFLLSSIEKLAFTHVLCVGAPRIHEEIQLRRKSGDTALQSMLLDLDERYAQIYSPALYAKYNMFNHHFFERTGKKKMIRFLNDASHKALLLTDPPFGGMVEALAQSFRKISNMWEEIIAPSPLSKERGISIPMMWIFPYFLENRIISSAPSFTMLDYKVEYDNHNLYNNTHKQKGSPVRIFTNISPTQFHLPEEDGYWFCKSCQRFSSKENKHCKECGTCPSKDGTTYVHCDACLRCVKPSRIHCFKCEVCVLKDHKCGKIPLSGCHICGDAGHKRRDCPQRHKTTSNKSLKRKNGSAFETHQKKKKKKD